MNKINKALYLQHLKNYVKLFDDVNLNKIDKKLALEKIEAYKCYNAVTTFDLLIRNVDNNVEHFLNLSMSFASCYMVLYMIINECDVGFNNELFMKNVHKLKDYIECVM